MKKFLRNLIIYAAFVITITLGLNALYRPKADDIGTFAGGVPDNIQICNFGSSHGQYGFNYEDFADKYTCFNFALGSQTLLYDYRILTNFRDKLQKGTRVFVVVSYHSLYGKPDT